jgi:hypothetical protein
LEVAGLAGGISSDWYLIKAQRILNECGRYAALVRMTMLVAERLGIPDFPSKCSKHTYSDRYKLGLLVLKEVMDLSFDDLVDTMPCIRGVMEIGGIRRPPDASTLRKFRDRVGTHLFDAAVRETARLMCGTSVVMAVDATGFSMSSASGHFVKRLTQMGVKRYSVKDYAKATLAVDTDTFAVLSCDVRTTNISDFRLFRPAVLGAALSGVCITAVCADKGYDGEEMHECAKEILGEDTETVIPVREQKKHRSGKSPKGKHRKQMAAAFNKAVYNRRAIVETVNSMLKRKMGDVVYGKKRDTVAKEIKLIVLAHNLRLIMDVFMSKGRIS